MALPDSVFDDSDVKQTQTIGLPDSVFDDSDLNPKTASNAINYNNAGQMMASNNPVAAYVAGIPKGVEQLGYNANKLGVNALNKAFNLNLPVPQDPLAYGPSNPLTALGNLENANPNAAKFGQLSGQIGTALALNPSTIPGALATGGSLGVLSDPEHPIRSGLIGALLNGVATAIPIGANAFSSSIGKALDNELNNAATSLGITLPIGTATKNTFTGRVLEQNALPTVPFSGAAQAFHSIGDQLEQKAQDAVNSMRSSTPVSQIPENIQSALQKGFDDAQSQKKLLYKNVDARAKETGTTVPNNFYLNGYDDPTAGVHVPGVNDLLARSAGSTPELQLSGSTRGFLQNISNANEPGEYLGPSATMEKAPPNELPFAQASLVRGKLNDLAHGMSQSSDPFQRGEGQLLQGLRQLKLMDMEDAVNKSGDTQLMDLYQNAQNHYANNIAPYDDPTIKQYLTNGSRADNPDLLINSFLKTGPNNQPTLLNNLLSKLPDPQKNDVGYYYLTRSLPRDNSGQPILNSTTLTKLNDNLQNYDPQIRNQLIPPDVQSTLQNIKTVKGGIPNLLLNPPTGLRAGDVGSSVALITAIHSALNSPHPVAALSSLGGALSAANLYTRAATSPWLRSLITKQ